MSLSLARLCIMITDGVYILSRMYDRTLANPHPIPRPFSALRYRFESLIGVTGSRMARFRPGWREVTVACADLVWRPHMISILVFEVRLCMSSP